MNRRGFFKLAGGAAAAAIAAPAVEQIAQAAAFIPADRLDRVPRPIINPFKNLPTGIFLGNTVTDTNIGWMVGHSYSRIEAENYYRLPERYIHSPSGPVGIIRDDYDEVMGYIRRGEPIPAGEYHVSRTLDLTGVRGTVRGSGMDRTIIRADGPRAVRMTEWSTERGYTYDYSPGLDARMTGLALPAGWGR